MSESEKMEAFGRMVFGMITDVLLMPADDAYGRKTVTMPDGKGGKHSLALIVATHPVANVMERAIPLKRELMDADGSPGAAQ